MMDRDHPHKTPVTSTWTADFLTRGEGNKALVDWLRDNSISWKTRRRLLQTNTDTFPCQVSPDFKNGENIQMVSVVCTRAAGDGS